MGCGFFGVEVPERDIGAEKVYSVADGGRVSDSCPGLEDADEGWGFEEAGKEEIPLEVGEGEELFGGRHREPETGDDPSFYMEKRKSKRNFIAPFRL